MVCNDTLATSVPPVANYVFFTNFRHFLHAHLELVSAPLEPLVFRSASWPSDCFARENKEKAREKGGGLDMRKSIATVTALGIGAGSVYLLNRGRRARNTTSNSDAANGKSATSDAPVIDDHATDQSEAADILRRIRDAAFHSSDEKLALALGRPSEEIETWTRGSGVIDADVVMKARQLAVQRGVEI